MYVPSQKRQKNTEFRRIQCDIFLLNQQYKYIQFNVISDGEQKIIIQTVIIIFQLINYLLKLYVMDIYYISC